MRFIYLLFLNFIIEILLISHSPIFDIYTFIVGNG